MIFFVDGFNLYHSLRECEQLESRRLRWLDLHALCGSLLHAIPGRCELTQVVYFTALARHMESSRPGTVARHLRYLDALQGTGVETRLGHFKRRATRCPLCGRSFHRWEEKQTDVAIATRLAKAASAGNHERLVLLSGDTDLVPAIREARGTWAANVGVVFPARRTNAQLRQAADWSVNLDAASYSRHQFPRTVRHSDGRCVERPAEW